MPRQPEWEKRRAKNMRRKSRGVARREARAERVAELAIKRSAKEQLAWLDKKGFAAKKERAKLAARLANIDEPELVGTS